jgi:hypothetical protein
MGQTTQTSCSNVHFAVFVDPMMESVPFPIEVTLIVCDVASQLLRMIS